MSLPEITNGVIETVILREFKKCSIRIRSRINLIVIS